MTFQPGDVKAGDMVKVTLDDFEIHKCGYGYVGAMRKLRGKIFRVKSIYDDGHGLTLEGIGLSWSLNQFESADDVRV